MSSIRPPANVDRVRVEAFGGVWQTVAPPALVYVDRRAMREIGVGEHPLWSEKADRRLSAPLEAHLSLTNRCRSSCEHCYTDSGAALEGELDTEGWKKAFAALRAMGVFHLALGGGESTLREDLFELADYARSIGLAPNLTTNGSGVTDANAKAFRRFGLVNVSLDGLEPDASMPRGEGAVEIAQRASERLKRAGVNTGLNCVLTKANIDRVQPLIEWARGLGLEEIEFLRYKPAGRGTESYLERRVDPQRLVAFILQLRKWSRRYRPLKLKIDCSLVPFLSATRPSLRMMDRFGVSGCVGADQLIGAKADGRVSPCSFCEPGDLTLDRITEGWNSDRQLLDFHRTTTEPPAPCNACRYRTVCRGGCRVVATFLTGDPNAPDPECPKVMRHQNPRWRWLRRAPLS